MMIHGGCGGQIVEVLGAEPYEDDDGSKHPPIRCLKCGREILGDSNIRIPGYDDEEPA